MANLSGEWPPLPDISANDPLADVKKALYQAQLQAEVARRQLALDQAKARLQSELDTRKAEAQAQLDTRKAEAQAQLDTRKAEAQAQLDATKAQAAADVDAAKQDATESASLHQAVHQAYLDVAKATIDRSRAAADFVQKAATALGTIYTGLLAFTYSTAAGSGVLLPSRGFVPAVFFALAIFLATAYLAFITRVPDAPPDQTSGLPRQLEAFELFGFMEWVARGALVRDYALRAAVLSLGAAVLFLPVAYLNIGDNQAAIVAVAAAVVVFALAGFAPRLMALAHRGIAAP